MSQPIDIKVQLQTQLDEATKTKESLQGKGAFKRDPKKLQQLEVEIAQLQNLINSFNPKSNSDLRSVNSAFSSLYNTLIKVGLATGNASEKLKQLYSELKKKQEQLNTRSEAKSSIASRVDESGHLTKKDYWTKEKLTKAHIQYKNKQIAADPNLLRTNVEKAKTEG